MFDNATFDGSYTFDSGTPKVLATPNTGGYAGTGGIFSMSVSFTGTLDPSVAGPYATDTLNITVNNDVPGPLDEYLVTGSSSTDALLFIEIRLQDFTGTAFSNTSLPLAPPNLAAFTILAFALFDGTLDNPIEAEGVLRTLQCTAGCGLTAPEPNPILLVGVALGALGLARRRGTRPCPLFPLSPERRRSCAIMCRWQFCSLVPRYWVAYRCPAGPSTVWC